MTDKDDLKLLIVDLKKQREALEAKESKLKSLEEELKEILAKASKVSVEEAKKLLLDQVQIDLTADIAKKIRAAEEKIKLEANEKAKAILVDAMRHGATSYVAEFTVSSVPVANEEVKGRIIGREGRNIRTFERETGVEIEIDETNEIRLSSFDSVRREIARRALEELLKDTRIQPSRIEEVVARIKTQMDDVLLEEGKKIAEMCGVYNLPLDILKLIGRYKFRTSYGQNLGVHTIEETKIGVALANEIDANVETVRLGCLLHDIGKVVTDEEGTHVDAGVAVLKRHGFPKEVVSCVAEHHEDKPFSSIESAVVNLADHVSGARPGARSEDYQSYATRLKELENASMSFDGVEKAYAISAGREVRVFVSPEKVDDYSTAFLAREIAKKIELEQSYPGVVKVTVIRETRVSETAK